MGEFTYAVGSRGRRFRNSDEGGGLSLADVSKNT